MNGVDNTIRDTLKAGDGNWVQFGDFMDAIRKVVTPEQAVARRIKRRDSNRRANGYGGNGREPPVARQVDIGYRAIINNSLWYFIKSGQAETKKDGRKVLAARWTG